MNQSHRFWFYLALALGQPVAVLQQQVDSREFSEWIIFNEIEPIGEYRKDIRHGMLAYTFANAFSKKTTPIENFVPNYWRRSRQEMAPDQQLAILKRSAKRGIRR